jgi:multidrug efflux system membrane fusion protein
MSIKRAVQLVVALAAVGGIGYYVKVHTSQAAPAKEGKGAGGDRVVPVTTVKVERKNVPDWLEGLGTVAAWQQVTVRPQVDGRLDAISFTEGDKVTKGQLLATIDPRPFQAQLHQAEGMLAKDRASLVDGNKNLERYKQLAADKLVPAQQVDDQGAVVGQAEGAIRVDEAAVESARLNLDYAQVKAPIDGVVGVRLVDAGNLVRAADATGLVVITQLDPAAVIVTVPQDALGRLHAAVKRGDVVVEVSSRDGLIPLGKGTLTVIDNQINAATATLKLKCKVDNPTGDLWPNQFVKARVLLETRTDALVIPAAAVQRGPNGGLLVYTVVDGKAVAKPVEVAMTSGDSAVISSGLDLGDSVVIEGQNQLRPGAAVAEHAPGEDTIAQPAAAGGDGKDGKDGKKEGKGKHKKDKDQKDQPQ